MTQPNPKQVFGGFKAGLTRKINKANIYMQNVEREYSEQEDVRINKMVTDIEDQMKRWEAVFQKDLVGALARANAADVDTHQAELEAQDDKAEKCMDDLRTYLKNLRTQGGNQENQGARGQAQSVTTKIDYALRPEKLQMSFTLEEFIDWSEKFRAYFDHNKKALERSDIAMSRQLLHAVLDSRLINALKTEANVTNNTPIVEVGGCLDNQ